MGYVPINDISVLSTQFLLSSMNDVMDIARTFKELYNREKQLVDVPREVTVLRVHIEKKIDYAAELLEQVAPTFQKTLDADQSSPLTERLKDDVARKKVLQEKITNIVIDLYDRVTVYKQQLDQI